MTMRKFVAAIVLLTLHGLASSAEPSAKQEAKVPAKKQAAKASGPAKPKSVAKASSGKTEPSAAALMQPSPIPDVKVQEAVAGEVHTGQMVCELGNTVTVTPDPNQSARFIVQMKKNIYHMTPVQTTTGAVRLEDAQAGAMWLQLPHKSMLMNSKLGQRMADDCQNEQQASAAQAMQLNPPPSLLDDPTIAKK